MKRKWIFILFIIVLVSAGCNQKSKEPEVSDRSDEQSLEVNTDLAKEEMDRIEVQLINQDNVKVGVATLIEEKQGVKITIDAHHLPAGVHGFHIHERGICEAPSFESAGGHFNPTDRLHGFKNPEGFHAGDLENLEVNEEGTVRKTLVNEYVTLQENKANSLLQGEGTALVIHADPDDYYSQPAGNAGERIACGVISEKKKDKT